MSANKSDIGCFVEIPARQLQDHLRRVFLASVEAKTVEFEKQDSHHKSRALVAIYERMVAHDAPRIAQLLEIEMGEVEKAIRVQTACAGKGRILESHYAAAMSTMSGDSA
jgi:hypothetical protein